MSRPLRPGLCADVEANSTRAGAAIIQWTCTGAANQRWVAKSVNGGHTLAARSSGMLLTAAGTADGAPVAQERAGASAVQTWTFTARS